MKKLKVTNKKRFAISLICISVILLFSVGGTLAYLFDSGAPVKNIFVPGKVSTYVSETLSGGQKTAIKIQNTGNGPAYIRVAVVMNWVDKDGVVVPGTLPTLPNAASGWTKGTDGFYYYTSEVKASAYTGVLFNTAITETNAPAGTHLQVTILADGIQSQGTDGTNKAVVDAWGLDPSTL